MKFLFNELWFGLMKNSVQMCVVQLSMRRQRNRYCFKWIQSKFREKAKFDLSSLVYGLKKKKKSPIRKFYVLSLVFIWSLRSLWTLWSLREKKSSAIVAIIAIIWKPLSRDRSNKGERNIGNLSQTRAICMTASQEMKCFLLFDKIYDYTVHDFVVGSSNSDDGT